MTKKGHNWTPEQIKKRADANRGRRNSPETIRRMSEAHKGKLSSKKGQHFPQYQGEHSAHWKGGKPHCLDCGKQIKYGAKRCINCHIRRLWKGKDVHIETLHQWIKAHKPKPEFCECCGIKLAYDCANISGKYLRDVNDYEWLCRRCHMLKDGRLEAARLRAPYTIKPKQDEVCHILAS